MKIGTDTRTVDKIFIGVGSKPFIPDIPGLNGTGYMTSAQALSRNELPESLIDLFYGYESNIDDRPFFCYYFKVIEHAILPPLFFRLIIRILLRNV